ncbi:unnamed protein product [Psylliodes chrysocephalus]|uniref:Serine protease K12H4.7 n=1 Tax=Psylliodes chrysocephalus TaxID=3402493 RepID=A0A9P0GFG2_9CUCU|nr:unnamed protein product [Psylliodes chrysocephala]
MCLLKILLVFSFCFVVAWFKNIEEHEKKSIYTGTHQYYGHIALRGNNLEDSEPSKFERWFTQHLDHFNPNDERKFQQRYYVNDELFNTTSRNVAFLMIGGEGTAFGSKVTTGAWYDLYAKQFKPILFYLEHRYYGKSNPTENLSNENLVYLTSQQALADLAFFIEAMNKQHELSSDVKWIVFGGSYAGSLAAWMRLKYPHLVHGAVSSSAPLLAKLDFSEYLKVVRDALRANSVECVNAIKMGIKQIDTLLLQSAGQQIIADKFKYFENIDRSNNKSIDFSLFYNRLKHEFSLVVQYNPEEFMSVENLCDIMTSENFGMEIDRLAVVDYSFSKNRTNSLEAGNRQWLYQTCTEFGFLQTSSSKSQLFGDKLQLDFYEKQCLDDFGPKFNKTFLENAVKRTNVLYGGLNIEVNNVVFVHGSLDPWHALGITQSKNGAPVILIEGGSHCSDMHNPLPNDSPQLKAARYQIHRIIGSWFNL